MCSLGQSKYHQIAPQISIPRFDFNEHIDMEVYSTKDGNKRQGYNIVERNDMLQYHYFSQEYSVVKTASHIILLTITKGGIKQYIGFASFNTPALNQSLRSALYGREFYRFLLGQDFFDIPCIAISRLVILPSFRGLGLNKEFQKLMLNYFENNNIFLVDIYSNLLHSMDFLSNRFNKSFFTLEKFQEIFDFIGFSNTKDNSGPIKKMIAKGMNQRGLGGIWINPNYNNILQRYYKEAYRLDISDKEIQNQVVNFKLFTFEEIKNFKDNNIPFILSNWFTMQSLLENKKEFKKATVPLDISQYKAPKLNLERLDRKDTNGHKNAHTA